MKIDKKYEMIVTLTTMVLIMTCVVTFVSVGVNFGFNPGFATKWIKCAGFHIAIPVVLVLMPIIKEMLQKLFVSNYIKS